MPKKAPLRPIQSRFLAILTWEDPRVEPHLIHMSLEEEVDLEGAGLLLKKHLGSDFEFPEEFFETVKHRLGSFAPTSAQTTLVAHYPNDWSITQEIGLFLLWLNRTKEFHRLG